MSEVAERAAPVGASADATDELGRRHTSRRTLLWIGGLGALLILTLPVATGLGPVAIPVATVAKVVGHHLLGWPQAVTWSAAQDAIVEQVRVPRVLLGAVVGAGLALTGTAVQAMVRNVLADPYLLGVTAVQQKAQNLPKQSVAVTAGISTGSFFVYGPPRSPTPRLRHSARRTRSVT